MAIDTSIYRAFAQPVKSIADYDNEYAQGEQNRLALAMQRQKADEYNRAIEDSNKLRGVVSTFDNDRAGNQMKLLQAGRLKEAEEYGKGTREAQKAQLEQEKASLENGLQRMSAIAQIMSGVKDQATAEAARQKVAEITGKPIDPTVPYVYDPEEIERARLQAMPLVEQLKERHLKVSEKLAADKFAYDQKNDAANRGVTIRGQDMTASTARAAREQADRHFNAGQQAPQYDAERGVIVDRRSGIARQVRDANGQPLAGKEKPLTEFQGKSAAFADRALLADQALSGLDYNPAAINSKAAVGRTPLIGGALEAATNVMLSPENQRAEQAQRDFVNAVLRQESGAAIGRDEFDNARRQYFPQPGDSDEVKAQKAANRQTAIAGLQRNAGASYKAPGRTSQPRGGAPNTNARGWALHVDANGNRAYVSPDGKQFEEVR
jgi:hypothetical protein